MENVFLISEFKTDSLHKYMRPIYAEMHFHQFDTDDEKRNLVRKLCPIFFRRLRQYREIGLDCISTKYEIPLERLQLFESGQISGDLAIEYAYVSECGGYAEVMTFERQVKEFKHPSFKESRFEHAQIAARAGFVIPGIDYKNLNPEGATVLPFVKEEECECR